MQNGVCHAKNFADIGRCNSQKVRIYYPLLGGACESFLKGRNPEAITRAVKVKICSTIQVDAVITCLDNTKSLNTLIPKSI